MDSQLARIAASLLAIEPGSRIPRVSDFATETSLGRGTIQGALRLLEEIGAIVLEARGHLGTFLVRTDRELLWDIGTWFCYGCNAFTIFEKI